MFETEQDTAMIETSCSLFNCADPNRAARTNGVHAPDNIGLCVVSADSNIVGEGFLDTRECSANTEREARCTRIDLLMPTA